MGSSAGLSEYIRKARAYFDEERRRVARAYRPYRYASLTASLLFDFYFLWLIVFSGTGRLLERIAPAYLHPAATAAVWATVALTLRTLLELPISYLTRYQWPKKFGLVVHSPAQYLKDHIVSLAVSLPLVAAGAAVLQWLILRHGRLWWLGASLLATAATVLITMVMPVLLMPLFNRFVPLDEGALKRSLLEMAERAGARVTGVYVMDMSRRTTTANAMLTGLGPTRRMIVGDTLLKGFPAEEVQVVMAHELGHHYHGHITKGLLLSALALPPIFFLADLAISWPSTMAGATPGSMRYLGCLAGVLYVLNFVLSPVYNRISRFFEWQSDEFALRITGLAGVAARMFARLADGALSDTDPPALVRFFFYTHPPVLERIVHALRFQASP